MMLLTKPFVDRFVAVTRCADLPEYGLPRIQHLTIPATESVPSSASKPKGESPGGKLISAGLAFSLIIAGVLIMLVLNDGTLTSASEAGDETEFVTIAWLDETSKAATPTTEQTGQQESRLLAGDAEQSKQFLDRWQEHSDRVRTLAVEWKQTATYAPGSRDGKDVRRHDENGRPFPEKPAEVTHHCRVIISGTKWRYETIGVNWNSELEQFAASEDIAASNGTWCVSYVTFDGPVPEPRGQAFVYRSVDTAIRTRSPQAAPAFLFARPLQKPIGSLLQWGNSHPTMRQAEDDSSSELVYEIPGQPLKAAALYRVDRDRPWLLRHLSYSGRVEVNVKYNADTDQAPSGWTYTHRKPDGSLDSIFRAEVTSWKVNFPIDDEKFTVKLPPGTKVWDRTGLADVSAYWEAGTDLDQASDAVRQAFSNGKKYTPSVSDSPDKMLTPDRD